MFADVDTHLAWLRRFALQQAMAVLPLGRASAVVVRVDAGLMAGASSRLQREVLRIGSASDCDVQLLDDGVGDQHASIRFHTSVFGTLADITAIKPLHLGREALAEAASSGLVRLPLTLSLGGATLRVTSPGRAGFLRRIRRDWLTFAALGMIVAVSLVLFVSQMVRTAQIESVEAAMMASSKQSSAPRADGLVLAQSQLGETGLGEMVSLAAGEVGSLVATGRIPAARWSEWEAFLAWYDRKSDLPTLVNMVTMAPKLVELRPIETVQLHDPATVYFASGEPARIGDVLEEGWTLTAIDAEGLTLERASETTRINF